MGCGLLSLGLVYETTNVMLSMGLRIIGAGEVGKRVTEGQGLLWVQRELGEGSGEVWAGARVDLHKKTHVQRLSTMPDTPWTQILKNIRTFCKWIILVKHRRLHYSTLHPKYQDTIWSL